MNIKGKLRVLLEIGVAFAITQTSFAANTEKIDQASGNPVVGLHYRVEMPDGSVLRGVTDADGKTMRVATRGSVPLTLFWGDDPEDPDAE